MAAPDEVVPGLVPPPEQVQEIRRPARVLGVRALPMAALGALPTDIPRIYGIATVDGGGRVTDQHLIRALGWVPRERVNITVSEGSVIVRAEPDGVFTLTGKGHLQIPAAVRRWCAMTVGDRVLLVAAPDDALLIVHAVAALDALVTRYQDILQGGDE